MFTTTEPFTRGRGNATPDLLTAASGAISGAVAFLPHVSVTFDARRAPRARGQRSRRERGGHVRGIVEGVLDGVRALSSGQRPPSGQPLRFRALATCARRPAQARRRGRAGDAREREWVREHRGLQRERRVYLDHADATLREHHARVDSVRAESAAGVTERAPRAFWSNCSAPDIFCAETDGQRDPSMN